MNRTLFIFALAVAAGCAGAADVSTSSHALQDCLPQANYCGTIGQPLPPTKPWDGGALPQMSPHSIAIVEQVGQTEYVAYGVDWPQGKVAWVRAVTSSQLGAFVDQMSNAGQGMWMRPPPVPNPPIIGQEALFLLEEGFRVYQGRTNALESGAACTGGPIADPGF